MSEEDRERGILTSDDIDYLRGKVSKEGQNERRTRHRIRQRIQNAIVDFAIAFEYLEARDRIQILLRTDRNSPHSFAHVGEEIGPPELEWDLLDVDDNKPVLFLGGLRSMHAFSYLTLFESLEDVDYLERDDSHETAVVEALVEESLQDVYGKRGEVKDVDVNISVTEYDVDLDAIETRFRSEDPVSEEEVQWLIQTRRISFEEMVACVRDESRHKNWERDSGSTEKQI